MAGICPSRVTPWCSMASRLFTGSKTSSVTAVPPANSDVRRISDCPPTCEAGRLHSTLCSGPKPKAAARHRFWQAMPRCESSAGLGEPVEPVVKITCAPSCSLLSQEEVSLCADEAQAADHLGRFEPQIERRMNHAHAKTGIFE